MFNVSYNVLCILCFALFNIYIYIFHMLISHNYHILYITYFELVILYYIVFDYIVLYLIVIYYYRYFFVVLYCMFYILSHYITLYYNRSLITHHIHVYNITYINFRVYYITIYI